MEDSKIIELYFARSEAAIQETQNKYGRYCHYIAYHILYSESDADECVNDTYYNVWDNIPPQKPTNFRVFIGSITRNLALNRYDYNNAQKRLPKFEVALDELNECTQGRQFAVEEELILKELINRFLGTLPKRERVVFLQRYWYFCSVKEIASNVGIRESNVKVILYRVREQFKDYLNKEGVLI